MNICKSDIYFIVVLCIIFYLHFFTNNKTENFQSTTTGYQADIEAIRNLSSIASQLTLSNQLTMPGALNVTNNLNIGDASYKSGTSNIIGTSSNKFLTFDNTFNSAAGAGVPANKIRLHNNNDAWIAGFGMEGSAISYHSGDNHNFYVKSGSNYGNLALRIDGNKNTTIYNKLATWDIYAGGTIACGKDGKDKKSYMDSNGDAYFSNSLTAYNCKLGGGVGAYMVDGNANGNMVAILCSIANTNWFGLTDRDDSYFILPGYRIQIFTNFNYTNDNNENSNLPLNDFDNTNGTQTIYKTLDNKQNKVSSIKLYFLGTEVKINGVS